MRLPDGFERRMRALLSDEWPAFLCALSDTPVRGIRMQPHKMSLCPDVWERLSPVPWAENAFYISLDSPLGARPLHEAGAYYIQEPSAMAAAEALSPAPGERVLDLCASPGGKATQLAFMTGEDGLLVANEYVPDRAKILSRNIERMGIGNTVVTCASPALLAAKWPEYFDKILVDAPCSGEGMFRKNEDAVFRWTDDAPEGCKRRQLEILESAARLLRPGGRLVYSTCTFNDTENEGVIGAFLRSHQEFSLVPFKLDGLAPASEGMLRVWPHKAMGEGCFAALMRKSGEEGRETPVRPLPAPSREEESIYARFASECLENPPLPNARFAEKLIRLPKQCPPLEGIKVLRAGLHIGCASGGRFEPSHALALYAEAKEKERLSEPQALLYQAGETLACAETARGYAAAALGGIQLGWVKRSQGQMKNHYPKGLRRRVSPEEQNKERYE